MNVLNEYITFLKEYNKLLERGVKDVLNSSISSNFIWNNDIEYFINEGICESTLTEIFSSKFKNSAFIFSLKKPNKPIIKIPDGFEGIIDFDETRNKFKSVTKDDEEELQIFQNSTEGKVEIEKLEKFGKNKDVYSKFYRAYNDIKNDSNLEIVLSVGFIQYSKFNNNENLSKTNQHLFHFPLSIDIDSDNKIKISFSDSEDPYIDFSFLNSTPIEKEELNKIVDTFKDGISERGYEYLFEDDFKELISNSLEKISSNSEFEDSIYKPEKDTFKEDYFKISFSPAINIKKKNPRFFEKLMDSIIKFSEDNKIEAKLFNLLIRNPESSGSNSYTKSNYFRDELFENNKSKIKNLNGDEDFSVFFPLPFNQEQKQIYENYLENRLTVVTGPPGTGKSHTIVNILCSLLAQGKRVLVTAQTDKALESLLDKIPKTFDNLIFTKIQLETNPNRFSLDRSVENISEILTAKSHSDVKSKIEKLDKLKAEYVNHKSENIKALEKEYDKIRINDSFDNLRAYQIVEKFERKESQEWNWIQDELSDEELSDFEIIKENILRYKELSGIEIRYNNLDIDIPSILEKLENFDFKTFLSIQQQCSERLNLLGLTEYSKDKVLKIQLDRITDVAGKFLNSDIVLKNIKELTEVQKQISSQISQENLTTNKTFSDITENETKYLLDIETYLSFAENGKVGFFTKIVNSNFKQVSYLEQFTINGKKCNTKTEILQLKLLIGNLVIINKKFTLLKKNGFLFSFDNNSNLLEKSKVLNEILRKVERNKEVVSIIQLNTDFINFSDYSQIDLFDIDALSKKAILLKDDFEKLRNIDRELTGQKEMLRNIDLAIEQSSIKRDFSDFLPVDKIEDIQKFEQVKSKLLEIGKQIELEQTFSNLKKYLTGLLPNTFDSLKNIPNHYISKENFEYASADKFIQKNESIDLQKCKEQISSINKEIFDVKCNILFDLAKANFKKKFNKDETNSFINLLEGYKHNLSESARKIRNQTQYKILTRENSITISKSLSCWVMKFNDVLNSVGDEPEIFDCIIVDEASQLDFNSLILGYYAENMIIVGDDKQTSPSHLTGGVNGDDFESIRNKYLGFLGKNIIQIKNDNSLFMLSKMIAGTSNLTLKEHFRCVPEIIEFSKFHFYDNSLRPLKQINSNRLNPKETIFVEDAFIEDKIVYKEIEEIRKFLQGILKDEQYSNKSIGVVSLGLTKHTEKLKDIKEDLANEFGKEKIDKHKLIIEDSPKFQGDERDIMIISLGVALNFHKLEDNQNAKPQAIISNPDELKKINVALSRAKEQMILFHSVKHNDLKQNDFRSKILSFFKDEIKPIPPLQIDDENIERNKYNYPKPFDSWFEFDIAKALIENGYGYIQPQYKVKEKEPFNNPKLGEKGYVNYRIDLVVHNNGKVIAIECDGDPFHSLPEDVAYDVERQEFLERVGWKICRVLYSAFKRSPQVEVQKIINFIEQNTKKDHSITQKKSKVEDSEIENNTNNLVGTLPKNKSYVEISEQNSNTLNSTIQSNESIKYHKHKPIEEDLEESNQLNLFSAGNNTICYFNLYNDNTYKIQQHSDNNSLFSLPIEERYKNGFLLQCYDNGHINKVNVESILNKKMNYPYSKGKNPDANILYLKLIESDSIIALKVKRNSKIIFKAHMTEKISGRDLLYLQGYKILYQNSDSIEYKILPKNIYKDIKRLVFSSFTAEGSSVRNAYYANEWDIIKQFIPNLNK